ncbi:unnamed protein product [Urochloa humidicola]
MASSPSAPAPAVLPALPSPAAVSVAVLPRRAPAPPAAALRAGVRRRGAALVAAAALDDLRPAIDEYPEGVLSGEWPENFSLLSYADLRAYLESQIATAGEMESTVDEVMSSPAITLTPEKTVLEAAALMLKEKVHRIPVVNGQQQVIGIVTRTDVFQALEANN